MQSWIRCSGTFCTGVVLMMATLVSWSLPTTADPSSSAARAASVNNKSITISDARMASLPRRIEIDLSEQRLRAWEGKKLVYSFRISTGKRSTPTPTGKFLINSKYRTNRMRGRGYDIPDVPYAMYFHRGYAIHGAYWHNRFGIPVSRGCVNLPVKQARQLYNWSSVGTLVVVRR
ncbi:L,D-transpeptidase [Nostocaceae cyanobacterium CENA357]|uniref:L,D-transpeptidase n=1 Tax=Atlanticothrix silvestris CENA357 TaxID=1725252 RepID=A0A8J7KYN3_9CYAN|nr:L,D-transpeptidase [Atlanticothrix silvestris]MBH8551156.1 L,D-transpeptidase [Atlanticothrix silvestris CENA357]